MKKIFSLPWRNHKYLFGMVAILLALLGVGGYWLWKTGQRVSMATRVPASAIGYVEVTSLAGLRDDLTATPAWRDLAVVTGSSRWSLSALMTELGAAGLPVPGDELALLSGSQLALVLTAIEVRAQEVRPRLALLIETRRSTEGARAGVEARLRDLASKLYGDGKFEVRVEQYAGIAVTSFHPHGREDEMGDEDGPGDKERGLFMAPLANGWIVANHIDPLRQSLDAWLGRAPTLASSFHWQLARRRMAGLAPGNETATVDGVFGFVPGDGMVRLWRSATHLVASGSPAQSVLAGVVGEVATELTARAGDGLAFHEQYGKGGALTRYLVLLRADLLDALHAGVKPSNSRLLNQSNTSILETLPTDLTELTIYQVESPTRAVSAVEAAISARIGAGQSFVLHQFLNAARESFLGIQDNAAANAAIGDELIEARLGNESDERIWLIEMRDPTAMTRLARSYLRPTPELAHLEDSWRPGGIVDSGDPRRGAAMVLGGYLALGKPDRLRSLLDAKGRIGSRPQGEGHPLIRTGPPVAGSPLVIGYSRTAQILPSEVLTLGRLMTGRSAPKSEPEALAGAVARLPPIVRKIDLAPVGIEIESRSALGNLALLAALIDRLPFRPDRESEGR